MDANRFDLLAKTLTDAATRRGLLLRLSALPLGAALAALLGEEESGAGRRKRRKARHRRRQNRRQGNRKQKGKGKKKGNNNDKGGNRSKCSETTNCPDGQICVEGSCAACDVCPGCAGDSVQAAISAAKPGDRIVICPSSYDENLTIDKDLTLIGAGSASGANLTQVKGTGGASVVAISAGTVSLQHLRILGFGNIANNVEDGGGIHNAGTLELIGCAVTEHFSTFHGGGIYNEEGSNLTLTGCKVDGNHAEVAGGGLYSLGTATIAGSEISNNLVTFGGGGGIYAAGSLTIDATSRVTGNEREDSTDPDDGGGIYNDGAMVTLASGQIVTNNTPSNCGGDPVPTCIEV